MAFPTQEQAQSAATTKSYNGRKTKAAEWGRPLEDLVADVTSFLRRHGEKASVDGHTNISLADASNTSNSL